MNAEKLADIGLTLFFTRGVGLHTWAEVGNLDREVELYKRLSGSLRRVNFVTYGGIRDRAFRGRLEGVHVLPAEWRRRRGLTALEIMLRHGRELVGTDVFKTNQIPGSEVPILLKRYLGKKLIVRCGYLYSRNTALRTQDEKAVHEALQLEKSAFAAADMGIVSSAWQRDIVIGQYGVEPARIRVIPNYVVTGVFRPNPGIEKKYDLVFVGRSGPEKNLGNLLEALRERKTNGRSVSLLMIGGCCRDAALQENAKLFDLDVTFAGSVPNFDLPALLNQARVFIQPSLYEGHPKTLLEAMSCGLPCIGSDVTGIKEDIEHGVTGYLCGTDSDAIAEAIDVVLSDASLREKLGHNARDYIADNYSLDRVLEMEMEVIREVTGR